MCVCFLQLQRDKAFKVFFFFFTTLPPHYSRFFPHITLVNFGFHATGVSFSPRNVIFGLREPCTIRNLAHGKITIYHAFFYFTHRLVWGLHLLLSAGTPAAG